MCDHASQTKPTNDLQRSRAASVSRAAAAGNWAASSTALSFWRYLVSSSAWRRVIRFTQDWFDKIDFLLGQFREIKPRAGIDCGEACVRKRRRSICSVKRQLERPSSLAFVRLVFIQLLLSHEVSTAHDADHNFNRRKAGLSNEFFAHFVRPVSRTRASACARPPTTVCHNRHLREEFLLGTGTWNGYW